jgi:hypothetical protein
VARFAWIEIMPDRSAGRVAAAMERFIAAFGRTPHTVLTDRAVEPPPVRGPTAGGSEFTDRFGGDAPGRTGRPSGRHALDHVRAAHGI